MYHYRLYGLHIITDFEFIQLITEDEAFANDFNTVVISEGQFPDEYRCMNSCYKFLSHDKAYLINSYCNLLFEDGNKILYERKNSVTDTLLASYILGWGMSAIGLQRNMLSIHCACLADDQGAIIVSGYSGSGKSTISNYLLDMGYQLVADDMVLVDAFSEEKAFVYPAFPYTKLCRDAAIDCGYSLDDLIYIDEEKDKFLVPFKGAFSTDKKPVKAIVMLTLNNQSEVFSETIDGVRKMYACMDTLFIPGIVNDKQCGPSLGNMCLKFASKVPVYHVSRPVNKETSKEVLAAVLGFIGSEKILNNR